MKKALPKFHCQKALSHEKHVSCGAKKVLAYSLSRQDFKIVPWYRKCHSCAKTKFARFI